MANETTIWGLIFIHRLEEILHQETILSNEDYGQVYQLMAAVELQQQQGDDGNLASAQTMIRKALDCRFLKIWKLFTQIKTDTNS